MEVANEELEGLYAWVDEIPLSRLKRSLSRDFADGVLMAEIVHHYYPRLIDLHNYSGANSTKQKLYNWSTLNQKVFKRLGFVIARAECEAVCGGEQGAIERVLKLVKVKMAEYADAGGNKSLTGAAHSLRSSHSEQSLGGTYSDAQQEVAGAQSHDALHHSVVAQPANDEAEPRLEMQDIDPVVEQELAFRQEVIDRLQETNEVLEIKIQKLEQLLQIKNAKIQTLLDRLQASGV